MYGQFNNEKERDDFLWEATRLLVYTKYRTLLTDNTNRIEAHWFYCYGSFRLTFKVVPKDITEGDNHEILAQDPLVQKISKKCFSTDEMLVDSIAVSNVTHLEVLAGASKLEEMLQETT